MKTALYAAHHSLGAKMVEFGGWEMPVQYKGIIQEHLSVRHHVGVFDVSHMGQIYIEGKDAERFLDYLATNLIIGKEAGTATYTVWCNSAGMCVDDLIVYKLHPEKFFVVVNASNRQKDLQHVLEQASGWDVKITDRYEDRGILAVQGPKASALIVDLFPDISNLKHMHVVSTGYQNENLILSRTGYTGEDGFEIYASNKIIVDLWETLLREGSKYGIEPVGLGARDTLRLEMGYALYGHEISEEIAPNESVSSWTVKWKQHDFLGKSALEEMRSSAKVRSEYGIRLIDKGIAREGYEVFKAGERIGRVTSGTFSPSLEQSIAIVLVETNLDEGDSVQVKIRQSMCSAIVVKLPFYRKTPVE